MKFFDGARLNKPQSPNKWADLLPLKFLTYIHEFTDPSSLYYRGSLIYHGMDALYSAHFTALRTLIH